MCVCVCLCVCVFLYVCVCIHKENCFLLHVPHVSDSEKSVFGIDFSPVANHDMPDSVGSESFDQAAVSTPLPSEPITGEWPPQEGLSEDLCDNFRGIQGVFNSCYMDAVLFAMFMFTDVYDGMLHRPAPHGLSVDEKHTYESFQAQLKENIVNPLRW